MIGSVAASTSLVVTVAAIHNSMTTSLDRITELASEADLEISATSAAGFSESVIEPVEDLEGVRAAVPVVRAEGVVGGEDVALIGVDARAIEFAGPLSSELSAKLRPFRDRPELLLRGVFVAERISKEMMKSERRLTLWVAGGERSVAVLGTLGGKAAQINEGLLIVGLRGVVQELSGKPGRIDHLFISFDQGADPSVLERRIRMMLPDGTSLTSAGLRADQAAADLLPLRLAMLTLVASVLIIVGFLIFTTAQLAVLQRSKELTAMKALGGGRRDLVLASSIEASVQSLIGAVAGAAAGWVFARTLIAEVPPFAVSTLGVRVSFAPGWSALLTGLAVGTLVPLVAGIGPALAATRGSPARLEREDPWSTAAGVRAKLTGGAAAALIAAGLGIGLIGAAPPTAALATAFLVVGAMLAGRVMAPMIGRSAAWLVARAGPSGRLAAAALTRSPRRVWATTMAVALAGAVVVSTSGIAGSVESEIRRMFAPYRSMELVVQTSPADRPPSDHSMPGSWQADLEGLEGVEAAVPSRFTHVTLGRDRVYVAGLSGNSHHPMLALAEPAGRERFIENEGVIVSGGFAGSRGLVVGSPIEITTLDGHETSKVAAIVDITFGNAGGAMAVPFGAMKPWFGAEGVSRFELRLSEESEATAREAVRSFARAASLPLFVFTGDQQANEASAFVRSLVRLFELVTWATTPIVSLLVFAALFTSVFQRTRELGVLRAIGASRGQVMASIVYEGIAVGTVAAVIGLMLGSCIQLIGLRSSAGLIGTHIPFALSLTPLLLGAGVAISSSVVGSVVPAFRAGRLNITRATKKD